MTKALELRELEDSELDMRLVETRQELFNLKFQSVTGKLDNYSRLRSLRAEIARIATIIRERDIADEQGRTQDAQPHHTDLRPSKYGPGTLKIDHKVETLDQGDSTGEPSDDIAEDVQGDLDQSGGNSQESSELESPGGDD